MWFSIEIEMIYLEETKKNPELSLVPSPQSTNVYHKATITKTVW